MTETLFNRKKSKSVVLLILLIILFVFQMPLSKKVYFFSYLDEVYAILCFPLIILNYRFILKRVRGENIMMLAFFSIFSILGIVSNLKYKYTTTFNMILDFFINFKFYFSLITTILLFRNNIKFIIKNREKFIKFIKIILFIFVIFFVLQYIIDGYNHAIFYYSPFYFSGILVFLFLFSFWLLKNKKNNYVIFILLILMVSTNTTKSMGFTLFVILYFLISKIKIKNKMLVLFFICCVVLLFAHDEIMYYFFEISGARKALLNGMVKIVKMYFPLGTGFGTYASAFSVNPYSPIYKILGIDKVWGISQNNPIFISDSYWPMVFGQTGIFGGVCYLCGLILLIKNMYLCTRHNNRSNDCIIFGYTYLFICSVAESSFVQSYATCVSIVFGIIICESLYYNSKRRNNNE